MGPLPRAAWSLAVAATTFFLAACTHATSPSGSSQSIPPGRATLQEPAADCDLEPAEPSEGTVLVYLVKQNFRIPRRDEFVPVARRMTRNQAQTPLRAALLELLAGPTPTETRLGCLSVFSRRSTGLLKDVAIVDRQAVVDLHDFAGKLPRGTTADTLFVTQMNLTVFQFPAVQSVRYQLNGSCERFFNRLQGNCQIFRR